MAYTAADSSAELTTSPYASSHEACGVRVPSYVRQPAEARQYRDQPTGSSASFGSRELTVIKQIRLHRRSC